MIISVLQMGRLERGGFSNVLNIPSKWQCYDSRISSLNQNLMLQITVIK